MERARGVDRLALSGRAEGVARYGLRFYLHSLGRRPRLQAVGVVLWYLPVW